MTKSTKSILVLVGAVTILSVVLFAVGPVLAQSGSSNSGQNGQGNNQVVISTGDTLGMLVSRYNLSGSNLNDFLSMNTSLPLVPGQRVRFPAGVSVNIPNTGSSSSGTSAQPTGTATSGAGSQPTAAVTGTATSSSSGSSGASATSTVVPSTSSSSSSSNSSNSSSNSTSGSSQTSQTYVTKEGDTLGTVLNMMGFQGGASSSAGSMAATATTVVTGTATTSAAGSSTASATGTAMPSVTGTATSASGAAGGAASTATATTASSSSSSSSSSNSTSQSTTGTAANDSVAQFVRLNSALRFGLVVSLPAGIPATGNNQGTSGTAGSTGNTNGTTGSNSSNGSSVNNQGSNSKFTNEGAPASAERPETNNCDINPPKGFGFYKMHSNDTLQSIANRFGVTTQQLLSLNAGKSFFGGQVILVPGVEAPGQWNVAGYCESGGNDNDSGGSSSSK